ncbi:MAG: Flagellar biosynthetic protein FliR [Spirochaetes bacterium ADurb.Bin218]|jgi:flagellar biosynthetic protein FliR|nr:flagellar biosynthetic protein FliR [Spirochaetota bacterium]OQA98916.1 MAG: Flagellar biosynthetic protein FliR [Spirochaetes bacterium ADurb.Bin218]HOQ11647.1 flagellar biosynthetic protein FliR [Spirochaetota bacterium]HPD77133.1 flagellar biosynthetic protein FliR [Spirochaetota bacterium]HRS63841.1 flagellar biosynthetic protein FliR [Spirochaetota bacterium]
MEYFVTNFQAFLLVLIRINAMMMVAPFFSSGVIPLRLKAMLSFLITLVVFPVLSATTVKVPGTMGLYYLLVLQEVAIGIFIGFLVSIIFSAFQLSGQYYAAQIGFGINEVYDPLAQVSVPLLGQMKNFIGILVFLFINGHHFLIEAICRSFELAPFFGVSKAATGGFLKYIVYAFSGMFIVALKIALPIVAVSFLISVSMGVLAKAAPQMNIMMLGFPFQIFGAFLLLIITTPMVIKIMQVAIERSIKFLTGVLLHWPG